MAIQCYQSALLQLYSTIAAQLNLTPPSHLLIYTLPSQLDSTNTTILYHHNSTQLSSTRLNLTQLNSTNTTILYHHNSTQLNSTNTAILYHNNSTRLYYLNSTQLNSTNTTILYHHNSTRLNLTQLHSALPNSSILY